MTIRVAAAQMRSRTTMAASAQAVVGMIEWGARRGARFLVTPEMILTGYHGRFDQAERDRLVDGVIRPACARHEIALILGAGSYRDARGRAVRKPRIQLTVVDRRGRVAGYHDKVLPTGGDLSWCSRGDPRRLRVFRVDGLVFGTTICNDYWATPIFTTLPDLNVPVLLSRKGARVIFHAIASGGGRQYLDFHTKRIEERAIRAGVWVVSANAVSGRAPSNVPSGVVDPHGRWRARAPLAGEHLVFGNVTVGQKPPGLFRTRTGIL